MKRVFRIFFTGLGFLFLAGLLFSAGVYVRYRLIVHAKPRPNERFASPSYPLVKTVNPFIGTGGYPWVCGNNFPGASMPFGMVRLSPETASILISRRALNTSGYFYGDNKICGFSHTRLSGTGATDGGHFLILPVNRSPSGKERKKGKFVRFSHRDETAFPGYYAVQLPGEKILAELTATERVGVHRYTFLKSDHPHLLFYIGNTIGDYRSSEGEVRIKPENHEIEGSIRTFGTFAQRYGGIKVYFVARTDRAFRSFGIWDDEGFHPGKQSLTGDHPGVDLEFAGVDEETQIGIKVAISYVSIENARENLEKEAAGKSFDEILQAAQQSWEKKLSLIRIDEESPEKRTVFYTAMYRIFQMPTIFNDVNRDYFGFDKIVHRANGFKYYTDLSLWDTFRTLHPLYNLIARSEQRDMMVSLITMAKEGGWLPRWPSGNGYTGSMLGSPADITIADAWLNGIRDFDVNYAYSAMCKVALGPTSPGSAFSGRRGVEHYIKYHYCPADLMDKAVSKTLEYAWADFAIGKLAEALGKSDSAAMFFDHAQYYRNTWNPATGYFQPRNAAGGFVEKFKPTLLTYLDRTGEYTNDYVEGSALQWRWTVPFDTPGLISLFGSKEQFVTELNDFFEKSNPKMGTFSPGSYYWHGNEPDIHAAYLFNDAGRPGLTQKWVRWIQDNKYDTTYKGLDGNDDGATLSAWYVFSAMGFYPIAGTGIYQLGTPLYREAEINMDGKKLKIETGNFSSENIYVHKVWLNDTLLDRRWIRHSEITGGGVLRFEMGSEKDKR